MYTKINGLQHIGIGVKNHAASWKWFRTYFKMDIPFFNAESEAPLMVVYTKGKVINKRAAMVMNLKGGAAMEIVHPVSFTPKEPDFEPKIGDIGIFLCGIKSDDVELSRSLFTKDAIEVSPITLTSENKKTFFVKDINGLNFQVTEGDQWFSKSSYPTGGVSGCTVGVSDINKSLIFYKDLLGFDDVVYDKEGFFEDFASSLPNGNGKFRRVKLVQSKPIVGNFSDFTGEQYIELVQSTDDYSPKKIWKGRIWGDVGFLHIGLDVKGMHKLRNIFSNSNHPFTCDSKDALTMGASTKVHCTYLDDPDGILIEMIEVFKLPLIEKLGFYLHLEKYDPKKPLPKLLLKSLRFMRVKN